MEKIIKEKISADHLLYVSLKYTKTCDVIINLLHRWKIMIDLGMERLIDKAKKLEMAIEAKMPRIVMTTNNSNKVKPLLFLQRIGTSCMKKDIRN